MTARDEVQDRVRGLEMGADDYITKPFDDMDEYEKLKENIENKKKEEQRIKETRNGIFNVLADILKK